MKKNEKWPASGKVFLLRDVPIALALNYLIFFVSTYKDGFSWSESLLLALDGVNPLAGLLWFPLGLIFFPIGWLLIAGGVISLLGYFYFLNRVSFIPQIFLSAGYFLLSIAGHSAINF